MEVIAVRVDIPGNSPVLVLREVAGAGRLVPIFIGQAEASAIGFTLDGVVTPRPMTHDLFCDVIAHLGSVLQAVEITSVEQGTFYAELVMKVGEAESRISARPSDAIALALRVHCPIWAADEVVDEAGLLPDDDGDGESEGGDVVEEFRAFIDNVNPEDFAS
ncbi:MAG: bifunctional nuclease family protein [Acidimicrobiales bacterium]